MKQYNETAKQKVFDLRAKGMTYAKIAAKTKIPVPTIGVWLRNQESPSIKRDKTKAIFTISPKPINNVSKDLWLL